VISVGEAEYSFSRVAVQARSILGGNLQSGKPSYKSAFHTVPQSETGVKNKQGNVHERIAEPRERELG